MNRYHAALLEDVYSEALTDKQVRHALSITAQTLTLARLQLSARSHGAKGRAGAVLGLEPAPPALKG